MVAAGCRRADRGRHRRTRRRRSPCPHP
jgi:hypothetical protein